MRERLESLSDECVVYADLAHEFDCKFGPVRQLRGRMEKRLAEITKEAAGIQRCLAALNAAEKAEGTFAK